MIFNKYTISLISFFIITGKFSVSRECADCNKTYTAPCNMKYPYGDENQMNTDVTMNDTNVIVCSDRVSHVPEYGRCPLPPADSNEMKFTNPYIRCPDFPLLLDIGQILPEAPISSTNAQCKNCDVQLTPDGTAVNIKCNGCYDLPSTERMAELTEKEFVYTVYYVEIANYTSVKVEGRENFNP